MYLKEYLQRFCVIPTHLAKKMGFDPNKVFRIIRDGTLPSLSVAIRIEDFTEGKVTPRDIYNECIELKERKKEIAQQRKQKNSPKPQ